MALALVLRARKVARWLVVPAAGLVAAVASGCFTAGQGTQPPMDSFYFPTGLAASPDGKVLYVVNSDFDLQWNGGTLQTYHLDTIRKHASDLIAANVASSKACAVNPKSPRCTDMPASLAQDHIPFLTPWTPNCINQAPTGLGNSLGVHLGTSCSPQIDSTNAAYFVDSAIVGAFAEDLQVVQLPGTDRLRLFTPMAGNSTVTWADVGTVSSPSTAIACGQVNSRCDSLHQTGNDPNSPGNTRNLTMPGEPYGMAFTEDKTAIAVTSETDTKASNLTTTSQFDCGTGPCPTMQFYVENLPSGGISMATVPHDPYAVLRCEDVHDQEPCIRPAFLETFVGAAEVDLLRYYDDISYTTPSAQYRPYLVRERAISIPTNIGSDFRGIAIDTTPRLRCEAAATSSVERQQCGELPARVFIASRTPASVVYGELGLPSYAGAYDPDALVLQGNIPLPPGPSKVYTAPVIVRDTAGAHYEIRVFVVLFDTGAIAIINPDTVPPSVENYVYVGQNPYGMAFDAWGDGAEGNSAAPSLMDVATRKAVPLGMSQPGPYRFAYVGIFTQSYMQMIDLDDSAMTGTFEQVVFNFGQPAIPKGQANSNQGGSFL
jgi:hypothetical protein